MRAGFLGIRDPSWGVQIRLDEEVLEKGKVPGFVPVDLGGIGMRLYEEEEAVALQRYI